MLQGYLMSKDRPVAYFMDRTVTPLVPHLVPLCFGRGTGDIVDWLEHRALDGTRAHARMLKRVLGMSDTSDLNTALKAHGACVTDCYWVKLDGEELKWADVRPKSDAYWELALRGSIGTYDSEKDSPTSELTLGGSAEKCWHYAEGKWIMEKRGDDAQRFSEIFATRVGRYLGFDALVYEDKHERGSLLCWDFTEGRYNFEPAYNLVGEDENYLKSYEAFKAYSDNIAMQYLNMLCLDALVLNVDRHTLNYGVLRDQMTGEVVSFAPCFDYNMSLLSCGSPNAIANKTNPLMSEFLAFLRGCHIDYQTQMLTKEKLTQIADECLPYAGLPRSLVVDFVWSSYPKK